MMLYIPNTKALDSCFPYLSLCKTFDPGAGPQGHNLNKLGRGHKVMPHTKYQVSRPCGFRQEDFFMFFPILAYVILVTPGAGPFLAPGT